MAGSGQMVEFVVLRHTGVVPEHFDLMVQIPGEERLWTWRILTAPAGWKEKPPVAERLADHRAAYMTYEGPVSGNRGEVRRVMQGRGVLTRDGDFYDFVLTDIGCTVRLPFQSK